jgi:hypothetical protein
MRFCSHCKRINEGWPIRCRFCACTWSVRLCRSGHENPCTALFCGQCGSPDLSTTAPGGRLINWFFKLPEHCGVIGKILILVLPILILFAVVRNLEAILPLLFALTVMLLLARLVVNGVPSGIRKILMRYFRLATKKENNRAGKAR